MRMIMTGGLGNQLFQIAALIYYLEGSRNGQLDLRLGRPRLGLNSEVECLALSFPKNIQILEYSGISSRITHPTYLARKCLHWRLREANLESQRQSHLIQKIEPFALHLYMRAFTNFESPKEVGFDSVFVPSTDSALCGYFQSFHWLKSKHVLEFCLANFATVVTDLRWDPKTSIVMHYRLGDYVGDSKIGTLNPAYYLHAIEEQVRRFPHIDSLVVYSDDIPHAQKLLNNLPSIFKNVLWCDGQGQDSLSILREMVNGNFFIIGNSTFSWWAASLSNLRGDRNVIAPKYWFREINDPSNLVWDSWTRVPNTFL